MKWKSSNSHTIVRDNNPWQFTITKMVGVHSAQDKSFKCPICIYTEFHTDLKSDCFSSGLLRLTNLFNLYISLFLSIAPYLSLSLWEPRVSFERDSSIHFPLEVRHILKKVHPVSTKIFCMTEWNTHSACISSVYLANNKLIW